MSQRHDLQVVRMFAVDDEVREVAQGKSSDLAVNSDAWNFFSGRRVFRDHLHRMLNVLPETLGQMLALSAVPVKFRRNLELGELIRTNGRHRPNISLSIRRRTSSHSLVVANPASTAAQRRSISAAHAASTSPSEVARKLFNNRAAISARSCSGRSSALASNSSASLIRVYSSAAERENFHERRNLPLLK